MISQQSDISRQSLNSQALHKSAYQLNDNKLHRLIQDIDDDTMHKIWGGFGLHVSRQMRMGRGVQINKFGLFTFGPIDFSKEGITTQKIREKQQRQPVFLVSSEFAKGIGLKQSIYVDTTQQLRPYSLTTSGQIQQVQVNYSEISNLIQNDSLICKQGVNRMIQTLEQKIQQNGQADLEIPGIGFLLVRNNMCGINFYQSFIHSTQMILINLIQKNSVGLSINERKEKGEMTLTAANLNVLEYRNNFSTLSPEKTLQKKQNIELSPSANQYLQNSLGINLQQLIENQKIQQQFGEKSLLNRDNSSVFLPRYETGEKSISQRSVIRSHVIRDLSNGKKNSLHKTATSQKSYQTTSMSSEINFSLYTLSQRIIQFWMRLNHLDSEKAFIVLCESGLGKQSSYKFANIKYEQFKFCIEKNEIKLTPELIEEAFKQLDQKGKGFIDFIDWQRVFGEYLPSQIKHLDYIRDAILKKSLRTDDILRTMKLQRDSSPLNRKGLTEAIKLVDISVNEKKAEKIADSSVSVQALTKQLQSIEEEDNEHDPAWYKNLLWRIKLKFSNQLLIEDLKEKFTEYDERNEGYLDIASFKICLIKSQLKLCMSEINRMIRYTQKDNRDRIDYFNFLEQISNIENTRVPKERIFDRNDFLEKLKALYKKFASAHEFLKAVNKAFKIADDQSTNQKISFTKMANYLQENLFQDETSEYIESYIKQIDFNKDEFIDVFDIEQFINNGKYIDQVVALSESMKLNPIQTIKYLPATHYDSKKIENLSSLISNQNSNNNNYTYKFTTNASSNQNENAQHFSTQDPLPFPVNPLAEEKVNLILRDLRKTIDERHMTFRQLFDLLDSDKNGMISCHEFMSNLDNFIQLSQPMKDGFFAYIDKLHIGMIDLNSLLQVLEKSVIDNNKSQVTEDNWTWQNIMIQKLYEWYLKGNFPSEEEAFRALDFEYRGYITIQDLEKFLKDVLKIKEQELTQARVNRLFKIIDFYKSGRVGIIDFTKFLSQQKELQNIIKFQQMQSPTKNSDDAQYMKRSSSTQHSRIMKGSSKKSNNDVEILNVDWKKSVQQQLGLNISKQFPSTAASFEAISNYSNKVTFEKFTKWLELSNSLSGFDLTQSLLQELFAYFDPHKKGFLTESDWLSAFGHIDWKKQIVEELRNLVDLHFGKNSQIKSGFDFFISHNSRQDDQKVITLDGFYNTISYLNPGRFTKQEISEVWDQEINPLKRPGIDFNIFLGFLKKTIQNSTTFSRINPRNNKRLEGSNNVFSINSSRQADIANTKDDQKFRSFTPITVTGSKVETSPINRNQIQESKIKYISQGSKYVSPVKTNQNPKRLDASEISDYENGQQILNLNENSNMKGDRIDDNIQNNRYNQNSKNNLPKTNFGLNSSGIQNISSIFPSENSNQLISQGEQVIQKIKRILRTSFSVNVEDILRKYDDTQSGYLTNLQFKKAINQMNLGLKNTEVFFLINLCGLDGRLEIKKFLLLLQKSQEDDLILQRGKIQLKELSRKIYAYMISPLDAFRQYNTKGDGKMNLSEFENLLKQVSAFCSEQQVGYSVLKDMFGFLDRNQDGFIDIHEWNDALSSFYETQLHSGRVPDEKELQNEMESNNKKYRSRSSNNIVKDKNISLMKVHDILDQQMSEKNIKNQLLDYQERKNPIDRSGIFRINNRVQISSSKERIPSVTKVRNVDNLEVKDQDNILNILSRNRKYLMDLFQSYNHANIAITFELAKSLILKVLNGQGVKVSDQRIHQFIIFAEKDGIVDYKVLLDVYKDRILAAKQFIKQQQ